MNFLIYWILGAFFLGAAMFMLMDSQYLPFFMLSLTGVVSLVASVWLAPDPDDDD